MALDVLASCAVIGLRKDPAYFPKAMAEWFGIAPDSLSTIPIFPRVAPLASLLRETRTVDHLLEQDLEVYQAVRGAYESG